MILCRTGEENGDDHGPVALSQPVVAKEKGKVR
jgi:hypothetical protein